MKGAKDVKICRLCGEEQRNVMKLFGDDSRDVIRLVYSILDFLNGKCIDDGLFPKWLCVACHLEAESTEKFLLMVEEGQRKLQRRFSENKMENEMIEKLTTTVSQNKEGSILHQQKRRKATCAPMNFPLESMTQEEMQPLRKYPKRVRRQRKRFPCDPTPDVEKQNDAQSSLGGTVSKEVNAKTIDSGTLITIEPIAEFCSANGASLADLIAVDSDAIRYSKPTEPDIHLICEFCKEAFTKQHRFLKHLRTHNVSHYECTECVSTFQMQTELKHHQKETGHQGKAILIKSQNSVKHITNERKDPETDAETETTINIVVDNNGQITSIDSELNATLEEKDIVSSSPASDDDQLEQTQSKKSTAFKCLKCNKSYSTHYSVLRHYKQVHVGARPYKCQHCAASFKHATNLAYHSAKHTGIRNFKCDICDKAFVHKSELTIHMRTHNGDKPYVCEHCLKAFAHRSNMVTHMRLHSGQRPFTCETCGANFNSSSHWKLHKQMHLRHAQRALMSENKQAGHKIKNSSEVNQESDIIAQSVTSGTSSLLRPKDVIVKSVEILPPLNLQTTQASVITNIELKNLAQTARVNASPTKALKFECDQCLQRFKLKSALTKHLRTHTGEKPYKCPLCPRTFADASNFKRHKVLHKSATEELQNVSAQYKHNNMLLQFQRDKTAKSFAVVNASPTSSVASDPDPDGLEAVARADVISLTNVDSVGEREDSKLDMLDQVCLESKEPVPSSSSTKNLLVCISYPNPANPSDNKMTSFYV